MKKEELIISLLKSKQSIAELFDNNEFSSLWRWNKWYKKNP